MAGLRSTVNKHLQIIHLWVIKSVSAVYTVPICTGLNTICIYIREYIQNDIANLKQQQQKKDTTTKLGEFKSFHQNLFSCRHDALISVSTGPAHRRARTHIPIVQDGGVGAADTMLMFLSRFYRCYYFLHCSLNAPLLCERALRFPHSTS